LQSIVIASAVLSMVGYALFGSDTAARISCGTIAAMMAAIFIYGTIRNINGKQG
jgi:hypothetical protein